MTLEDLRRRVGVVTADQRAERVPPVVLDVLPDDVEIFPVDDDASDTEAFSARYGIALADCANTIVIRFRKEGTERHAAIVTLGSRRLDVNGAVKAVLGAQRLSFAKRESAVELTGMEFGGITAFGLPADWPILVDAAVMDRAFVVMGAGVRRSKLLMAPQVLLGVPHVQVATLTFDV